MSSSAAPGPTVVRPFASAGVVAPADAPRRRLSARQAATVDRLTEALLAELAAVGYDDLTVRSVARRAGVAPATAYTYFTSKAHLVAEVFWRRLRALPDPDLDPGAPAHVRVATALRALARWVTSEPALAAACTPALLGADPEVHALRDRIGGELHRRVATALSPAAHADDVHDDNDAAVVEALDLMVSGALLRAGTGHLSFDDLGERLAVLSRLVIGDRP